MEPTQETINNAKQLHSLSWISPELKSALENDFPELKENEDEKIREDLIGGLMWQRDNLDRLGKHDDSLILPGFCHTVGEHFAYLKRQKEQNSKDKEYTDFAIYHPTKNGKGEYECIPYSFYGSLTSFSEDKDLIDFLRTCFYTEEECNEWIEQQKEQNPTEWSEDYREEYLRTRFAFYTYKDEDDVLYLSNVFVEETSRNKGFGTKILVAAEKVAETIGAINIRLKVKRDSPANAWYRKHGYKFMALEGDYDWLKKTLEYQKPSKLDWSEGEMKVLDSIIDDYEKAAKSFCGYDGKIALLKAIRDGEYNLPKPKWSEKDEEHLDSIIKSYKELLNDYYASHGVDYIPYNTPVVSRTVLNDIEFLKSIRSQSKQDVFPSLSEKEIICLKRVLDYLRKEHNCYGGEDFTNEIAVLEWLITHPILVSNTNWKPSEEQMEYLAKGIVVLGEEGNCKTSAVLSELRDDLQKLL